MKTNKVLVLPYDKNWQMEFEKIKDELIKVLDDVTIGIEHVGSTSVNGLAAKPIIDIDVIIPTYSCFNIVVKRLNKLGYKYEKKLSIKDRELFKYTGEMHLMTHNLYVCPRNSIELKRHIILRNYLRKNKEAMENYNSIKLKATELFPNNMDKYIEYKTSYIEEVYKKYNLL